MTDVDIGKLYGVCRRFIDVWDRPYSDPAEFEPLVEELREVLWVQQEAHEVYRAWNEEGLGWIAGMQNTNWRQAWRDVGQALGDEPIDD